jgi:hypothetical protein
MKNKLKSISCSIKTQVLLLEILQINEMTFFKDHKISCIREATKMQIGQIHLEGGCDRCCVRSIFSISTVQETSKLHRMKSLKNEINF